MNYDALPTVAELVAKIPMPRPRRPSDPDEHDATEAASPGHLPAVDAPVEDEWNPDAIPLIPGYDLTEAVPVLVGAGVPAVVAVVVTRDPGPWLETTMASLDAQEYANLSTVVIDAASRVSPTQRVADSFPSAFVKRIEDETFAAAANAALGTIENAIFYLFCHDDAELQPGAVQALVEEAFRSNAGIVGAKLVDWDDPEHLRDIGSSVDKFGFAWPVAEPDELDQAQHDAVREVFVTSTAAMLVRCDLFADLGGFATDIDGSGEDLDLCWRARIAGARVVIMPAAVVRHREQAELGDRGVPSRRLVLRHQARIVLANYTPLHLVRILPQAILFSLLDMIVSVLRGRFRDAADVAAALGWNIWHLPTTLRIRGRVKQSRRTPDHEIRRLQVRGSARFSGFVRRARAASDRRLPAAWLAARELPSSMSEGAGVWGFGTAVVVGLVVIVGSRSLVGSGIPVLREFGMFGSASSMVREWWSGWRSAGLGSASGAPTLLGVAGVVSWIAVGSTGLIRTLMIVGPLPIGAWGMWRLMRHVARPSSRAIAVIVYIANPLPYNALAEGRWQALAIYAAMPLIVSRIARAGAWAPFDSAALAPGSSQRQIVDMGITLGIAAIVAPSVIMVALVTALVVCAAMSIGDRRGRPGHAFGITFGGAVVAGLLHLPWMLDVIRSSSRWIVMTGSTDTTVARSPLSSALRFASHAHGGTITLFVVAAAAAVLVLARDWRLRWAVVGAALAVTSFGAIVLVGRFSPGDYAPPTESLLVPAAVAVAFMVALGAESFAVDVLGGAFGFRQILSVLVAAAVVVGCSPLLVDMFDGRWGAPESDLRAAVAPLGGPGDQQFRTLWIGDPDLLPLTGWRLRPGVDVATSVGVRPDITSFAMQGPMAGELQLRASLATAAAGGTARLGALLAPFGIRYVVVVDRLAALPYGATQTPLPDDVSSSLSHQLDLSALDVAPGITVYENTAARPIRGIADTAAIEPFAMAGITALLSAGVPGEVAALDATTPPTGATGRLNSGGRLVVAQNRDPHWTLDAAGRSVQPRPAFAWSSMFVVDRAGPAHLRYHTRISTIVEHVAQLLVVLALLWLRRRRLSELRARRVPGAGAAVSPPEGGDADEGAPDDNDDDDPTDDRAGLDALPVDGVVT